MCVTESELREMQEEYALLFNKLDSVGGRMNARERALIGNELTKLMEILAKERERNRLNLAFRNLAMRS